MTEEAADLEAVLSTFDKVEANLVRLEEVASKLRHAAGADHEALRRSWRTLVRGLPPIDGFSITDEPMAEDDVTLLRIEASEVDVPPQPSLTPNAQSEQPPTNLLNTGIGSGTPETVQLVTER